MGRCIDYILQVFWQLLTYGDLDFTSLQRIFIINYLFIDIIGSGSKDRRLAKATFSVFAIVRNTVGTLYFDLESDVLKDDERKVIHFRNEDSRAEPYRGGGS